MTGMELLGLCFVALLIVAAVSDLITMTIPNRLTLALGAAFFAVALAAGLPLPVIGLHLLCGAGILMLGFAMFAFGWIGGGDAKLAAAIGMWIGPAHLLEWGLLTSIYGGALTFLILFARQLPLPLRLTNEPWIARLHHPKTGIPYGIALAAAGLMVYPQIELFSRLSV